MNSNIEYKVSRYTFLINNEKRYYIYNSLSNALIEIDEELYQFLNDAKKNNHQINSLVDTDIVTLLKSNRFIAENNEDEFLTYKSIIMAMRGERNSISLTIAPTMDCCFNCHYSFEKSKQPTYMSQDVMKGISK